MENIFTQKYADKIEDAKALLELIALAVEPRGEQIELFTERTKGIVLCCRIVQNLIEYGNKQIYTL
jgi:hypothetical protein